MRFKPSIVPGEEIGGDFAESGDEASELQLPRELAELAGQLRCEAEQLSASYPTKVDDYDCIGQSPRRPSVASKLVRSASNAFDGDGSVVSTASRDYRTLTRRVPTKAVTIVVTLTVALVLIAAPLTLLLDGMQSAPPSGTDTPLALDQHPVGQPNDSIVESRPLLKPGQAEPARAESGQREPFGTPSLTPVLMLQEASGPEAEGFLDLLEDELSSITSFSI